VGVLSLGVLTFFRSASRPATSVSGIINRPNHAVSKLSTTDAMVRAAEISRNTPPLFWFWFSLAAPMNASMKAASMKVSPIMMGIVAIEDSKRKRNVNKRV